MLLFWPTLRVAKIWFTRNWITFLWLIHPSLKFEPQNLRRLWNLTSLHWRSWPLERVYKVHWQDWIRSVSLWKIRVVAQYARPQTLVRHKSSIFIENHEQGVVDSFRFCESAVTSKESSTFAALACSVWESKRLAMTTIPLIFRACVPSTLIYMSKTWVLTRSRSIR